MRFIVLPSLIIATSLGMITISTAQPVRSKVFNDLQKAIEVHRDCINREARARVANSRAPDTSIILQVTTLCATEEKQWAVLAAENARSTRGDPVVIQKQIARQAYLNAEDEVRTLRGKRVKPDHN